MPASGAKGSRRTALAGYKFDSNIFALQPVSKQPPCRRAVVPLIPVYHGKARAHVR